MSSEQLPFTISTQGTVAPSGPHGVPPSDVQAAVVAEQDKTLTTKVGERVDALKESAQPIVDAAQPYVKAANETIINATQAGKEAVVSGAVQLGLVSDNSGPHGIPPSDVNHTGVVAQQDKSISTRVSEAAQPVIQPVVNAVQPIVQGVQVAVVAGKEAVISGAQAAGAAIGIGANTNPNQTPSGPHGVPPSEAGPGVVAQEDKSISTRVSEAAQPYIQPVVNAATPYAAQAAEVLGTAADRAADAITAARQSVAGTPGTNPPEGPHGLAPSEVNHTGVVAQEDKSLTTRIGEAAQPYIQPVVNAAQGAAQAVGGYAKAATDVLTTNSSQVGEQIAELRDEAQRQVGLGVAVQPGVRPEAPHGVAPTNYNHGGVVAQQDKTVVQVAGEKLAEVKDQAAAVVSNVVGEVKHQAGLGVNVQPGQKPEAPHGIAPTNYNHTGLVAQQDKTTLQVAGEKLAEVKDQAAAVVGNVVGEAKFQAGLGVNVQPGQKPEAPHGVAPSDANHTGLVSAQDKTTAQIAADKLANVAGQASGAVNNAVASAQAAAGEAKFQAGLGVHVPAGEKPEAPHGVAPTDYNHSGLVAQQDKSAVQVAGEKLAEVKDQAAAVVGNVVGEAKFQAGLGVNVQPGQKPEAPHGLAPSEHNHSGVVAQQDKTTAQVAQEKLTVAADKAAATVGSVVGSEKSL